MRRWCVCCGVLVFVFLPYPSAHAYERDVHYDLTKYLARWAAFSETEAEQLATADQELDAKPEFNPLPNIPQFCPQLSQLAVAAPTPAVIQAACKDDPEFQRMLTAQRAFHFVDGKRLQELRDSAFRGKNLKTLGHYLHALQDTFAHSLMDYQELPPMDKLVANLGFLPDEKIIGHLMYGHTVDKTYERPDLAELMARYVYTELTHFQGSANRWLEVEASIARFARERDAQKKLAYLSASPASQAAQMPSQPQGSAGPSQEAMPIKHIYAQPVNDQFMTNTATDNETGVRFSRVFYITPDISVLKGSQCGWSIEVIGELPQSRDPLPKVSDSESVSMWESLSDDMVKTILRKGKDFALSFVCPTTERIRVFLLDSTFTRNGYQFYAKAKGGYSSEDNFETLADYNLELATPQQTEEQPEQEVRPPGQIQERAAPSTQALAEDVPEELVRKLEANGMSRAEAIKSLKALKQKYGRYCYNKEDFRKDWRQGGFVALWSATEPGGLVPECSEKEEEAKLAEAPRESVAASPADRATLISYLGLYPGLVKTFPAGSSRVLRTRKIAAFPDAVQNEMFIRQLDSGAPYPAIDLFTIDKDGALYWGAYSGPLLRQVISGESYHIQRPFHKPYYMLKLPVRSGTTWKDETPSARIESTILTVEDVTVRAGRFEACAKVRGIVIHNDPRNRNADSETAQWLCPLIGMVKSIRKDKSGTWGPLTELISVTRAPQW